MKCDTLLSFLSNQGKELMNDKWVEVLMSFREEISKWREARRIGRKMYWGELERIHGRKELTDFIRMGKYKATTDAQGTECYVKIIEEQEIGKKRMQSVGTSRHSSNKQIDSSLNLT